MDLQNFFVDKIVLVIGGTGSIGSEIVSQLLKLNPKTIRILSNSENELWETKQRFLGFQEKLRFLLGDIRDYNRMNRAIKGVDYVFNAAAIKHVSISEYNPKEAIAVNIFGLENIIEASLIHKVIKLIHISTDKAVNPTTVMGATKMLGERLAMARQLTKGTQKTKISCVRFGNVLGSRGSIIPLIKEQIKSGNKVTLTDENMRRFFISITKAVELVLKAINISQGGEIFILKMPIVLIKDLIEVMIEEYSPKVGKKPESIKIEVIGSKIREKINEKLISKIEFRSCYEIEDMYIIYPDPKFEVDFSSMERQKNGLKVVIDENFQYSTKYALPLTKEEVRILLKKSGIF